MGRGCMWYRVLVGLMIGPAVGVLACVEGCQQVLEGREDVVVVSPWVVGSSTRPVGKSGGMVWFLLRGVVRRGVGGACGWWRACSAVLCYPGSRLWSRCVAAVWWLVGGVRCHVWFGWWWARRGVCCRCEVQAVAWGVGCAVCELAVFVVGSLGLVRLAGVGLGSLRAGG